MSLFAQNSSSLFVLFTTITDLIPGLNNSIKNFKKYLQRLAGCFLLGAYRKHPSGVK